MAEQENNTNDHTAEQAKQERQQPSDSKKNIYVEFTGKYYIVKNEGNESAMYESEDREATLDFANKVAEEHNVKVILDERIGEEDNRSPETGEGHGRAERRRYDEREENEEGPRKVIIEDDGRYYIVRNDGDKAKLYESKDKEASLDFARKVASDHGVDLVMLDRDKYIVLEESYSNGSADSNREERDSREETGSREERDSRDNREDKREDKREDRR